MSLPVLVCCRCSPTQKAHVTELIKTRTNKRVAAIGDGGNDVSMIQAANIGIGIVGKEGQQASLAADVSVLQFKSLTRLLLWHGRNSCMIFIVLNYRQAFCKTQPVCYSSWPHYFYYASSILCTFLLCSYSIISRCYFSWLHHW